MFAFGFSDFGNKETSLFGFIRVSWWICMVVLGAIFDFGHRDFGNIETFLCNIICARWIWMNDCGFGNIEPIICGSFTYSLNYHWAA